jgi:hypothetical protein
MQMNSGIILAGQQPDIMGQMDRGYQMGRQNAFAQLAQQHGPGLVQGDPNAMNAFAQFDPQFAMQARQTQLGMENTRLGMENTQQIMSMRAAEYARGLSAQEAAAQAQRIEQGLLQGIRFFQAGDLQSLNGLLESVGEQPIEDVSQFPAVAAQYKTVLDALKGVQGMQAQPPAPGNDYERYAQRELAAGREPMDEFAYRARIAEARGPETVVENNIQTGEGDKFYSELDKQQATMFNSMISDGLAAGRSLAQVDRLAAMLENTPTGFGGAIQAMLGDFGVETEGLSEIQAARALINQLVPAQRPAGSGPMSDADLELFKQSLPRIINQPGGNALIIETMRGIAAYQLQQAEIAELVAAREISPAEARKRLRDLVNPIDEFRARRKDLPPPAASPAPTPAGNPATIAPDDEALIRKYLQGGQ